MVSFNKTNASCNLLIQSGIDEIVLSIFHTKPSNDIGCLGILLANWRPTFLEKALNLFAVCFRSVTLTLSVTTIPDKIFGTKWSNPVKLDRKRKVWYLFLRVF